jgi:hypothetical protein
VLRPPASSSAPVPVAASLTFHSFEISHFMTCWTLAASMDQTAASILSSGPGRAYGPKTSGSPFVSARVWNASARYSSRALPERLDRAAFCRRLDPPVG